MRTFFMLMVPLIWGVVWLTMRQLLAGRMRTARTEEEDRGPVIEVKERRSRRRRGAPGCGRSGVHLLLRLVGSDSACRRCREMEEADERSEAEAAIAAAERALRDRRE
jgi:hypothetical protein